MSKARLAWFSPHPNHYNRFLFESILKRTNIELDFYFFSEKLQSYPWNEGFRLSSSAYYFKRFVFVDWKLLYDLIRGKRKQFDFILVAGWSEPTMIIFLTYLRIFRKPYLLYTDTPNMGRKNNAKQWLRKIWLSWILAGCKAVLVTGQNGFKSLEAWGARKGNIYNFPFATNLAFFSPGSDFPSPLHSTLRIFSSGRLDISHKGYDIALKALSMLKKRFPEVGFQYVVAGSGPDEGLMRKLASSLDIQEHVVFLGWLETRELLDNYRKADVLLHTAINDPFPNAVLEAMACGLIVIGSDSSGSVVERIQDKMNGLVHLTRSVESVYECLAYLIERSPQEIMDLKRKAFETARRWDVTYHVELLEQILFCN